MLDKSSFILRNGTTITVLNSKGMPKPKGQICYKKCYNKANFLTEVLQQQVNNNE